MRPKPWPPVTESRAERTAGLREVIGYGKLSVACYCSPPLYPARRGGTPKLCGAACMALNGSHFPHEARRTRDGPWSGPDDRRTNVLRVPIALRLLPSIVKRSVRRKPRRRASRRMRTTVGRNPGVSGQEGSYYQPHRIRQGRISVRANVRLSLCFCVAAECPQRLTSFYGKAFL